MQAVKYSRNLIPFLMFLAHKGQCDPLSSQYVCMRWWHTLSSYSKLMGQMESNFAVIFLLANLILC